MKRRQSKQHIVLSNRQRRLLLVGVIIVLVSLVVWDQGRDARRATGPDRSRYHDKTFQVVRVVDGDTLDIDSPDGQQKTTRIRLWGVDTPETRHPQKQEMHYGPEASAFTREMTLHQQVRILLEPYQQTRGKYGRLLAYVFLPDGSMLNERLLTQGYGYADPRFQHIYQQRFAQLHKQAQQAQRGLWQAARPVDWPDWYRRRHDPQLD